MKIAELVKRDTIRLNAEYDGKKFWFEASTNALTPKFLQQLKEADAKPTELAAALASAITDWEGGDDLPPTQEVLEKLPMDFIEVLLTRLTEVWQGNGQKPGKSANGSAVSAT